MPVAVLALLLMTSLSQSTQGALAKCKRHTLYPSKETSMSGEVDTHSPTFSSRCLPHFLQINPRSPILSSSNKFQWLHFSHLGMYSHCDDRFHISAKVPRVLLGVPQYHEILNSDLDIVSCTTGITSALKSWHSSNKFISAEYPRILSADNNA